MSVPFTIKDGRGTGISAGVSKSHGLQVAPVIPDVPPVGKVSRYRFFSARLGSTGGDGGTVNMNVNGSVTPQEFYIASHADYDLFITDLAMIIADTGLTHANFGGVSILANGYDLKVTEANETVYIIEKAKTSGQVIAFSGFTNPFGSTTTSWELTNWTGTTDAHVISIPIRNWVPGGLRIGRGTKDRITSVVNDNLTGLTEFYIRVFGYRHYPEAE